jgi:hypothetical protein
MADNDTQDTQGQQGAGQGGQGGAADADASASSESTTVDGGPHEPTDADASDGDVAALRREAAGRRRELRTVQAERDALREREDRRDRVEAERIASARMADPSDLWSLDGVDLANFRDQEGALVPDLVQASVSDALTRKPHWAAQRHPNLHQGVRRPERRAPSFGQALKADGGR